MYDRLNTQQKLAVECKDPKILCLAGAGTGKTYCMLARIDRLVELGADPESILVLTFTNAAAFEMRERYLARSSRRDKVPEFRTFHAFCYSLIVADSEVRKALGYPITPSIATEPEIKRVEVEAMLACGIPVSEKTFEKRRTLSQKDIFLQETLKKATYRLLHKHNLITFDNLCKGVCDLFSNQNPVIQKYLDKYRYIFVDEFQDTDPVQYRFVKAFSSSDIFVVGDALQSIYGFRGADSSIIESLVDDETWHTIELYENYRSTPEVCEFANENGKYVDSKYRIALTPVVQNTRLSKVQVENTEDYFNIYSALSQCIKKLKTCIGSSAILFRTNKEVDLCKSIFYREGIEYSTNQPLKHALEILEAVNDETYSIWWLATYLDSARYAQFLRIQKLEDTSESNADLAKFETLFGTVPATRTRLEEIRTVKDILKSDKPSDMVCSKILNYLNVLRFVATVNFDEISTDSIVPKLIEILNRDCKEKDDSVYVGTIHSVKGLEFDNVFLIGVGSNTFRLNSVENNNLYYVGITRAKTNLYVWKECKT